MRLVLSDIDAGDWQRPFRFSAPDETLIVSCDVSNADNVEDLAKATYDRFGHASAFQQRRSWNCRANLDGYAGRLEVTSAST